MVRDGRKNCGNHRKSDAEKPNYAENQRVVAEMSMLDEVAAGAARFAEAQTQPAGLDTEVDSMEVDTAKVAGHCAKRLVVAACEDGGPEGRPIRIDERENTTFEGKTSGSGSEETGQAARQEQNQNADLLQQMTLLCQTIQNLSKQMQEGFAAERTRRQQDFDIESQKRRDDYNNMERTMTAKMEEGFRNEQQARQQAQEEIMNGLKNQENA